jgi:hypothetical protein
LGKSDCYKAKCHKAKGWFGTFWFAANTLRNNQSMTGGLVEQGKLYLFCLTPTAMAILSSVDP